MSRQQWGHGYWRGVKDAQNGIVRKDVSETATLCVLYMMKNNIHKDHDKSLYSVRSFSVLSGLSEAVARKVYDYIMYNNPLGCYVSGDDFGDWMDDYFVLGATLSEDEINGAIEKIADKVDLRV